MNKEESWFTLTSGKRFYPFKEYLVDSIDIHDIAHALSNLCRFNGHCSRFYSVAEHSILCSYHVKGDENRLTALLHDATEAYVGDMIRPIKKFLPDFEDLEDRIWRAVALKFTLPFEMPDAVHVADNSVLMAEARDLLFPLGTMKFDYLGVDPPLGLLISGTMLPKEAEEAFLDRFNQLWRKA